MKIPNFELSYHWGKGLESKLSHVGSYLKTLASAYPWCEAIITPIGIDIHHKACIIEFLVHCWVQLFVNLKDKINELTMNSKNKNIRNLYRGINLFKGGHKPRSNLIRMVICLQIPTFWNRWKKYISQLLNVHRGQ
jgi:hypothetical protein